MFSDDLREPVRHRVSVIGLERDQRGCADDEVVEIDLRHVFRKSGSCIGDNAESADTGHETKRGKGCLATRRGVQVGSRSEERRARFIYSGRSEIASVADDEFLSAGWRARGEARRLVPTTLLKNG